MDQELEQEKVKIKEIMAHYPVKSGKIHLLASRGGRNKWRIETDKGDMILRQEYINPARMLFIAGAHWHLQQNGLPIAQLIPTKNGGLVLSAEDHAYILYESSNYEMIQYYNKEQMLLVMAYLAKFHEASKNYYPPEESRSRKRIGKWTKLYRWKLQELEDNKRIAQFYPENEFSALFLEHVDAMIRRGKEALEELNQPALADWTRETLESHSFCQQDVTMARLVLKDGQPFMQDLHSITIDLPSRDLRVLLNKMMKKLDVWDTKLAIDLLQAYDNAHPLKKEYYQVLWTDLKFPHLFCAAVHKYFLSQKKSWGDEKFLMNLQNVIAVEQSKGTFLQQMDPIIGKIKG
ncbi:MAG: CotS family spore coat protein [Sporolactobacillus sp.]